MGHDVCEAKGVCATVCADFVDGVIYFFLVSCQCCVMSTMKPASVLGTLSQMFTIERICLKMDRSAVTNDQTHFTTQLNL